MSYMIDRKYVFLVSAQLSMFKQKNDDTWSFKCPFCGDSKKSKTKTRGYFYRKKSGLSFKCHNCSLGCSFATFLSKINDSLFKDYRLERFKEEHNSPGLAKPTFDEFKVPRPQFKPSMGIPSIESLSQEHSAKKYILGRKIPKKFHSAIYYADDFLKFCDETFSGHGKKLIKEDPRIVIPFYSIEGDLLGVQGRALNNSKIRYITIKKSEDSGKAFGLNHLDLSKPIYVVEGPFDSMFLNNAVATMDSTLPSIKQILGDKDYIFCYDNQPRNPQIVSMMNSTIELGDKIVIWPQSEAKDINDMILSGMTIEELHSLIEENTYQGLRAKMKFISWRKI